MLQPVPLLNSVTQQVIRDFILHLCKGMRDVYHCIRYFLDNTHFLVMQESAIHIPICHAPKVNVCNQICSGCYWIISQDMVDH